MSHRKPPEGSKKPQWPERKFEPLDRIAKALKRKRAIQGLIPDKERLCDLTRALLAIKNKYDLALYQKAMPSGSTTDRRLEKIQLSLQRLAKDLAGGDMQSRRARLRISERHKGPSLHEWIDAIPAILAATKAARKVRGMRVAGRRELRALANEKKEGWESSVDPKRTLIGEVLPSLYKKFGGEDFAISKDETGSRVQHAGGVAFVVACHHAMGLGQISPETIKSHWMAAKRVTRPSK
jgi:hypothetical protein